MREHRWEFEARVGGLFGSPHEYFRCLYCDAMWCETHKEYARGGEDCLRVEPPAAKVPVSPRRAVLSSAVTIAVAGVIEWYVLEILDSMSGAQFDVRQFIMMMLFFVLVYLLSVMGRYRRSRSK
ncbi:MAG: hypothetical protein JRN71_00055 [Nitrososphaerota archaeon]|jgi:hypothetical protein|nr:hypothetical protein [Nitrososphaerota archaeon]MDG6937396.1 hypothetical protein [Nitrososphaerota archaeon]MDG6986149.1 hypothetical protein [Nitrososphaerota archaeon]MDG7004395.1 hypothetical protein [Nitrososphaerota archaeon]MDG7017676.1 hypothetical protein [Nitrososphaerota archaeon]